MATTNVIDRTFSYVATTDLTIADIGASNTTTIKLPPGAVLLRATLLTVTAFNSATTTTATVSDGTTTFVSGVDIKTTGSEVVSNVPAFYVSGGTLTITLAETGATATAGRAVFVCEYAILDNSVAGVYGN